MPRKPDLIVHSGDLPATVRALADLLAASPHFFDRGGPVKIVFSAEGGAPIAVQLTVNLVVIEAHRFCQPIKVDADGNRIPVTLSERVGRMYLDMVGGWGLRPLVGISTAPLLLPDGTIRSIQGYDDTTGQWCSNVPPLRVPARPTLAETKTALRFLRQTFRTFPFADAARKQNTMLGVEVVDLDRPPGSDESALLAALLTAICRPSLQLAPGLLVVAAAISGAGTGKGMLVRAISAIAYGVRPRAFTAGTEKAELDKRLAAELVEAAPAMFLDNVNGAVLRSATLASVLTERPARVRLLGVTRMVPLNSTAFVAITGNGLAISEDLARRFLVCELDARCEDPETRPFAAGFLEEIEARRGELLVAALTVWRWGRQNFAAIERGRPLGSYETWCAWVRDPLVALGCSDPVERIASVKASDPHRQHVAELLQVWWHHHADNPMKAVDLAEPVKAVADPQGRGRQHLVSHLNRLVGTRSAGLVLTREKPAGRWGAATYAVQQAKPGSANGMKHRDHRDHRMDGEPSSAPMPPMVPMPDAQQDDDSEHEGHLP